MLPERYEYEAPLTESRDRMISGFDQSAVLPISTAAAPIAIARTTSPPRRIPPSITTSIRSPTAATTSGSTRIEAGVPSRALIRSF